MFARRATQCLVVLAGIALLASCSSQPTLIAVTGTVTIDGKPASGVQVRFQPAEVDEKAPYTQYASGVTDAQGRFTLSVGDGSEGIQAGNYKVVFSRRVDRNNSQPANPKGKAEGPGVVELIPSRYRDRNETPVAAKVSENSKEFTFEIPSK